MKNNEKNYQNMKKIGAWILRIAHVFYIVFINMN